MPRRIERTPEQSRAIARRRRFQQEAEENEPSLLDRALTSGIADTIGSGLESYADSAIGDFHLGAERDVIDALYAGETPSAGSSALVALGAIPLVGRPARAVGTGGRALWGALRSGREAGRAGRGARAGRETVNPLQTELGRLAQSGQLDESAALGVRAGGRAVTGEGRTAYGRARQAAREQDIPGAQHRFARNPRIDVGRRPLFREPMVHERERMLRQGLHDAADPAGATRLGQAGGRGRAQQMRDQMLEARRGSNIGQRRGVFEGFGFSTLTGGPARQTARYARQQARQAGAGPVQAFTAGRGALRGARQAGEGIGTAAARQGRNLGLGLGGFYGAAGVSGWIRGEGGGGAEEELEHRNPLPGEDPLMFEGGGGPAGPASRADVEMGLGGELGMSEEEMIQAAIESHMMPYELQEALLSRAHEQAQQNVADIYGGAQSGLGGIQGESAQVSEEIQGGQQEVYGEAETRSENIPAEMQEDMISGAGGAVDTSGPTTAAVGPGLDALAEMAGLDQTATGEIGDATSAYLGDVGSSMTAEGARLQGVQELQHFQNMSQLAMEKQQQEMAIRNALNQVGGDVGGQTAGRFIDALYGGEEGEPLTREEQLEQMFQEDPRHHGGIDGWNLARENADPIVGETAEALLGSLLRSSGGDPTLAATDGMEAAQTIVPLEEADLDWQNPEEYNIWLQEVSANPYDAPTIGLPAEMVPGVRMQLESMFMAYGHG